MNKPYQGAYSRRRFSNYAINAQEEYPAEAQDAKRFALNVSWNGTQGRVAGSGDFHLEAETPACKAKATAVTGNVITLTASPNAGYHFEGWRGVPVAGVTEQTITVKMMSNYNVTAVFAPDMPGQPLDPDDGNHDEDPGDSYQNKPYRSGGIMDQVKPFVKKWWWAILIVAFIAYKEWKEAKK